jgi:hypothetical protein
MRISGPYAHDNLAIFLLHGPSRPGPVPLTLNEALLKGDVKIHETGTVSELSIENLGHEDVFIQYGDIVKGGRQDRVLTTSFVLTPRSGRVPIMALCVEQRRWARRGAEDMASFSGSYDSMPSRAAKYAMLRANYSSGQRASAEVQPAAGRTSRAAPARSPQGEMWDSVAVSQSKLRRAAASVEREAAMSPSSMQLYMESEAIGEAQKAYADALKAAGGAAEDAVGLVSVINGKVQSGEVYPSNGLFLKMWEKNLKASAVEALGEKSEASAAAAPPVPDVLAAFLAKAEKGEEAVLPLPNEAALVTREGDGALMSEARRANGEWVHRSYVAV